MEYAVSSTTIFPARRYNTPGDAAAVFNELPVEDNPYVVRWEGARNARVIASTIRMDKGAGEPFFTKSVSAFDQEFATAYEAANRRALDALAKDGNPTDRLARHSEEIATAAQDNRAYGESLENGVSKVGKTVDIDRKAANESVGPRGEAVNDASRVAPMSLDAATMERVAANRVKDTQQAAEELGLNGIEPAIDRKQQQQLEGEAKRAASVKIAEASQSEPPKVVTGRNPGGNQVGSDEVFTATKTEVKPLVPPEVEQKYLRVGDKYYHPKNTDVVAFEDKGNKLETRSNSDQVAETMVMIARARGWDEIKVSGTETFRKEVWLEATAHGLSVKGFTPSDADRAELVKRTGEIDANTVEGEGRAFRGRERDAGRPEAVSIQQAEGVTEADAGRRRAQAYIQRAPADAVKEHPELAGAYAAAAAIERRVEADGLTPEQVAVVRARVRDNLVNSIERGHTPQMRVREDVEVRREPQPHEQERGR